MDETEVEREKGNVTQMVELFFYCLALIVCGLPDFLRFTLLNRSIGRFRAIVIGLGAHRQLARGVTVKRGVRFSRTMRLVIGKDSRINEYVRLNGKSLEVGKNSLILSKSLIDCTGGVVIGAGTQIGRKNEIHSHKHLIHEKDVPVLQAGEVEAPVSIGDDVMLFSNVKVMPGVRIGKGVVVLNSAVVTRDLDDYGIYGGVPAVKVGERE